LTLAQYSILNLCIEAHGLLCGFGLKLMPCRANSIVCENTTHASYLKWVLGDTLVYILGLRL